MSALELRKLLAVGSGVGIEIGRDDLRVTAVRVRPSGVRLLGAATISDFESRPAADWGAIYADFLKRTGASYLSATVLLPRSDVIVRVIILPGVADRDMAGAIALQIDSLHPYPEDQAVYSWARLDAQDAVLIAITRRDVLDRYLTRFAEAGIKVAGFTVSAAVLYPALRLFGKAPAGGFVSLIQDGDGLEIYGESAARPVFSAAFEGDAERAGDLAASELRLEGAVEPVDPAALLPRLKGIPEGFDLSRNALAFAAALAGACPRLALPVNLLPAEARVSNSRLMYVPVAALGLCVIAGVIALASVKPVEDRKYMRAIQGEITRLEPLALRAGTLDQSIKTTRERTLMLDNFRRRSKEDLDALLELTRLLEPPAQLQSLELSRSTAVLNGGAEQAAQLLKILDSSPAFESSEFTVPLTRNGKFDVFRIRTARQGAVQ